MTLHAGGYDWQFVPEAGGSFTDSGSGNCHWRRRQPPAAPALSATAGDAAVHLSWTAPSDGGSPITGYKLYRGTSAGERDAAQDARHRDLLRRPVGRERHEVLLPRRRDQRRRARGRSPTRCSGRGRRASPSLTGAGRRRRREAVLERPARRRRADHRLQDLPRHQLRQRVDAQDRRRTSLHTPTPGSPTARTYYYKVAAINSVDQGWQSKEASASPGAGAGRSVADSVARGRLGEPLLERSLAAARRSSGTGCTAAPFPAARPC